MQNAKACIMQNAQARKARMLALLTEYSQLLTECKQDTSWVAEESTMGLAEEAVSTLFVFTDYPDELFSGQVE